MDVTNYVMSHQPNMRAKLRHKIVFRHNKTYTTFYYEDTQMCSYTNYLK